MYYVLCKKEAYVNISIGIKLQCVPKYKEYQNKSGTKIQGVQYYRWYLFITVLNFAEIQNT